MKLIANSSSFIVNSFFVLVFLLTVTYYLLPITSAQSQNCSGGSSIPRADGLVTTPSLSGIFNTSSGRCITNEQRAAFVSFKIPSYEDLKAIYYTSSKSSSTTTKHDSVASIANLPQGKIDLGGNTDHLYLFTDNVVISSPSDTTGNNTGVIFIEKDLTIGPISSNKFQQGGKDSGVVFVVKGDVIIDPTVTQIDAVIIASGTIYTAGTLCGTSSQTTSQLVVNGSLIALNDQRPVKFCRKLTNNLIQPSEKITFQPKYLSILKDIFADSLQKWSEITGEANIPSPGGNPPSPLPPPPPPDTPKYIFVSSKAYKGDLGGLSGADATCKSLADNSTVADLHNKTWKAWLSDSSTSAESRLTHSTTSYKLPNNTLVANNWNDLIDGSLSHQININENSGTNGEIVWTNSTMSGSIFSTTNTCSNWTLESSSLQSRTGDSTAKDKTWTDYNTNSCNIAFRLYCIEQ